MTRVQSRKHLDWIRKLPCCVCGDDTSTEAAHVRMSDCRIAKPESGMGRKPPDWFVLPLCGKHHRAQHQIGEWQYWVALKNSDPVLTALALYAHSGDYEVGCKIVKAALS